jgi:hypothetical protein
MQVQKKKMMKMKKYHLHRFHPLQYHLPHLFLLQERFKVHQGE